MPQSATQLKIKKAGEKLVGIFPFEFDAGKKKGGAETIPSTIQLIPIGAWEHPSYGPISVTASDIREFVMNFNAKVRKGVFITAGHEGFQELPACAWVDSVEARDDGLWGQVEWTDLGIKTLEDKQYKFFSPEYCPDYEDPQTHQIYRNVLTGGALTKQPYFKELAAIVMSTHNLNKFSETTMDLKTLVAKKLEELTAEEKTYLKEHKAELSEAEKTALTSVIDEPESTEEKEAREKKEGEDAAAKAEKEKGDANEAAGLNRDGSAKTVTASEGKMETISAAELNELRTNANKGMQAFAELEKAKVEKTVDSLVFSSTNSAGKFLVKSKDSLRAFMSTLNQTQREKFSGLMAQLPSTEIFKEAGGAAAVEGTAKTEVTTKVEAAMKAESKLSYSQALKKVFAENKGLAERYDAELVPVARAPHSA